MSVLTAAGSEHLSRLLPMVAAYHAYEGIASTENRRRPRWRRCCVARRWARSG